MKLLLLSVLVVTVCNVYAVLDCNGDEGGFAVISLCGICCRGNTGVPCVDAMDCSGVCNGNGTNDICQNCIHPEGETLNSTECTTSCGDLANECFIDCGTVTTCISICSLANARCLFTCDSSRTQDCNGDCPDIFSAPNATGDAITDSCGVCCQGNTGVVCEATKDCNGVCGGTAVEDCTGVCQGTAVADCTGVCQGTAVEDCAGVCQGTSVADCAGICGGTSVFDCNGDCGGTAALNDCGICVGGNTGIDETSGKDCLGVCNGAHTAQDCRDFCQFQYQFQKKGINGLCKAYCVAQNCPFTPQDSDHACTVVGAMLATRVEIAYSLPAGTVDPSDVCFDSDLNGTPDFLDSP